MNVKQKARIEMNTIEADEAHEEHEELRRQHDRLKANRDTLLETLKETWKLIERMPNYSSIIAPFTTGSLLDRKARAAIAQWREIKTRREKKLALTKRS